MLPCIASMRADIALRNASVWCGRVPQGNVRLHQDADAFPEAMFVCIEIMHAALLQKIGHRAQGLPHPFKMPFSQKKEENPSTQPWAILAQVTTWVIGYCSEIHFFKNVFLSSFLAGYTI